MVLAVVVRAVEVCAALIVDGTFDVVAGRHAVGAEITGDFQEIVELDSLIAFYARDWGFTAQVRVSKIFDNALTEIGFVIQHVMRESAFFGHAFCVVDVLSGAAGFGAGRDGLSVVIELERNADNVVAFFVQQGCGHG